MMEFQSGGTLIKLCGCYTPDCISIVDFLEIDRDFNEIVGQIRQIYDKLSSGNCHYYHSGRIQAQILGRGGTFSLEKARLYLSMDAGVTTITKAKNWLIQNVIQII